MYVRVLGVYSHMYVHFGDREHFSDNEGRGVEKEREKAIERGRSRTRLR